jgi:suppressor of G2 allele of SKP1
VYPLIPQFSTLISAQLSYANGDKVLLLEPLKGQIDPDTSNFTIGKVKVEIRLAKKAHGRWGNLVGDSPDREHPRTASSDLS